MEKGTLDHCKGCPRHPTGKMWERRLEGFWDDNFGSTDIEFNIVASIGIVSPSNPYFPSISA